MGEIGARGRIDLPVFSPSLKSKRMESRTCTILLAEDNPGDVFLVRRALNESFRQPDFTYTLQLANDGEEAIQWLERSEANQDKVDLVLLDLNLPRRDGIEVLGRLHTMPHLSLTPTIVMTSSDSPKDRDRCMALGASHYFHKPTELASFMEIGKIARHLIEHSPIAETQP